MKKSPLVLLCGHGHPINQLPKHSLSLVEKYPTVFHTNEEAAASPYYDYLIRQNYQPKVYLFTNSTSAFFNAISCGQALGISTEYISRINNANRIDNLMMLSLREKLYVSHLLVTANQLTPGEALLVRAFEEVFSSYGPLPDGGLSDL